MLHLAKGTHIDKATLLVRKAGEGQEKYIQIDMTKCIVTSVSTGGSGGEDRLTENVTLNFAEVKYEYFKQDAKGKTASAGEFNWDIAATAVSKALKPARWLSGPMVLCSGALRSCTGRVSAALSVCS